MTAEFTPKTKRLIYDRATEDHLHVPTCEAQVTPACTTVVTEIHHRKGRGKDPVLATAANACACCRMCHLYLEGHEALGTGWNIRKNGPELPSEVPVAYRGHSFVFLNLDGSTSPVEGVA